MSGLKALKSRINSVKSTRKITKAMQMVAAAKLRRAQEAAQSAAPYAAKLENIMSTVASAGADELTDIKILAGTGSDNIIALIVITADRGLCGGFNSGVIKKAVETARKLIVEKKEITIFTFGRRATEAMNSRFPGKVIGSRPGFSSGASDFTDIVNLISDFSARLEKEEIDECYAVYSKFHSVLIQEPKVEKLLPMSFHADSEGNPEIESGVSLQMTARELALRCASAKLFSYLLDSSAGEQAARMRAMDNATRNAGDMINKLSLKYNRTRQANITKELIEIISGAEAL